ncbi:MAG: Nitrogen permease regulator 3 [Sclerophora amabilis]|nr:MAG: Nitrogen permease regulator 3 [Sclerophora amabilis]
MSMTKLWNLILVRSSLAKAMSEVFISISASKIAHVFLNDHFDVSLQIPQVQSIADLPSYIEPQMPGVWLTTADSFDEDEDSEHNTIAKHFALLLLDDVENIVRDINTEPGPPKISDPLVKFVRIVKPTMSFLEISNTHGMSLQTISALSRHLIYWRRARAIPPLHQRDKYIVSPNADMRALPAATRAYEKRFPTLPSLPKMLSLLSGHPRAYSTLIPSKDHRAAYLEILAWLLKGGWVTQLRVFAWVRVSSEIRAAVDAEIVKAEADAPADHDEGGNSVTPTISPALSSNTAPQIQHPSITTAAAAAAAASGASSRRASSGGSSTATVTNQPTFPSDPIPFPYDNDLLSSRRSDLVRPSPAAAAAAEPLIILDPHRANAVESRYLTAVGAALPTAELREEAWPILLRYLNGQHALEKIAVREGRRHKDIWRWLMAFEREGCLLTIRHW